jgi:hypothetical protein
MAKRSRLVSGLCIGCAILIASPSWAATVVPAAGDLTINQGQGFKLIKGGMNANVGDSVMVGPGGAATVVYEDGCKVNVQPGAVATIAPLSPCASGSNAEDQQWTPAAIGFWALWLGGLSFIIYEITQAHGQPTHPASLG